MAWRVRLLPPLFRHRSWREHPTAPMVTRTACAASPFMRFAPRAYGCRCFRSSSSSSPIRASSSTCGALTSALSTASSALGSRSEGACAVASAAPTFRTCVSDPAQTSMRERRVKAVESQTVPPLDRVCAFLSRVSTRCSSSSRACIRTRRPAGSVDRAVNTIARQARLCAPVAHARPSTHHAVDRRSTARHL
eukprot:6181225-Pleurochrysis_carterae.AAC.4